MRHIIVTRLNCGLYSTFEAIKERQALTCTIDEYVVERIRLCKKLTMRSLAGQSNKHFSWWLVIDPQTPENIRKLIENELTLVQKIVEQRKFIGFKVPVPTDKPIIMTRLDSDDMLACDYNKNLRSLVNQIEPTTMVIEPFSWIRFDESISKFGSKNAVVVRKNTQPSFACTVCSMIKAAGDDRQVYDIVHTKFLDYIPQLIMHKGLVIGRFIGATNMIESNTCDWASRHLGPTSQDDVARIKKMFNI